MKEEQAVGIASKMYGARDACRRLSGWKEDMPKLKESLQAVSDREGKPVLEIAIAAIKKRSSEPYYIMWILAAACELIEPSDPDTD